MENKFVITNINRVAMVDKYEYKDQKTVFSSNLKHNELIFHFSGESRVYFNDKVFEIMPGTMRFLPCGESKRYIVERERRGECIFVSFDTDTAISDEAFVLAIKNAAHIGGLFKKMFAVWVAKGEGYYFETMSMIYKIFSELQKNNYLPEGQYKKIRPAINYIENHFLDEKISIPYLASLCKISESYFKKLFIGKYAMPPSVYIIQMKINCASDLLRSGQYSITQVAELCGYENVCYFSRQFKKYVGVSPSVFIEKYISSK
ncbi:MAG: helix-turn-helix transcriptional regulator [Clostridia bacterium]|nr:helix-turn-helix transcriptional regulator [Clostridia bacterium]